MSLTATLLLGDQITLPKGRRRRHRMDGIAPTNRSHIAHAEERAANIERVYQAICAGSRTRTEIIDSTGLSNATVWKATCELEIWPSGPRIVIRKESNKHFLYAI